MAHLQAQFLLEPTQDEDSVLFVWFLAIQVNVKWWWLQDRFEKFISYLLPRMNINYEFLHEDRTGIKNFIKDELGKKIIEGDEQLINLLNFGLDRFMRYEWQLVLSQLEQTQDPSGLQYSLESAFENITLLQQFKHGVRSQRHHEILSSINKANMKIVLEFIKQSLENSSIHQQAIIKRGLQTLRLAAPRISTESLLHFPIIRVLVGLVGDLRFRKTILKSFKSIFKFKQEGLTGISDLKVAEILLMIIKAYLLVVEQTFESQRDKANHMTIDLLTICFEILPKILIIMIKFNSQQAYYQLSNEDLTQTTQRAINEFNGIYRKLTTFFSMVLNEFDNLLPQQGMLSQQSLVFCLRNLLLIGFQIREKERSKDENMVINLAIYKFGTINSDFRSFYDEKELIRPVDNYKKLAKQFAKYIQAITDSKHQVFVDLIEDIQKRLIPSIGGNIGTDQVENAINTINTTIWSLTYAYEYNPKIMKNILATDLHHTLRKATELQVCSKLTDCLLLNSNYILQVYPEGKSYSLILKTLITCSNSEAQYLILIISQMLTADNSHQIVEFNDLEIVIEKLHQLEALDAEKERIMKLYPSIFQWLIRKMNQAANEGQVGKILDDLISKKIAKLHDFIQNDQARDQQNFRRTIYLFRILKDITTLLEQKFSSSNPPLHAYFILKWICNVVQGLVAQFLPKYEQFSNYLLLTQQQKVDLLHIIEFRKEYVVLSGCVIKMACISAYLEKNYTSLKLIEDLSAFIPMELRYRHDFDVQVEFRQKEYLYFAPLFYKWAISCPINQATEFINQSISTISDSMRNQVGYAFQFEKYRFWKETVQLLGWRLNMDNQDRLFNLFNEFQTPDVSLNHIKSLLDVFDALMNAINKGKNSRLRYLSFNKFFLKTFKSLFSSYAENSIIFDRLSTILDSQIKSCTVGIAMLLVEVHLPMKLKNQTGHKEMLLAAFTERNPSHLALKDYVVFVKGFRIPLNLP